MPASLIQELLNHRIKRVVDVRRRAFATVFDNGLTTKLSFGDGWVVAHLPSHAVARSAGPVRTTTTPEVAESPSTRPMEESTDGHESWSSPAT